jgi:Protein of unknown function (DUF2934)
MEAEREDEVRARAHAIWEREGRPKAGAERHWRQAEEELRAEGDGRAEAPTAEAATAAAEAEVATSPEGGAERPGPAAVEPRAEDRKRARSPAAEAGRTGG